MSNESLNILKRIKPLPFKDPTFVKPIFDLKKYYISIDDDIRKIFVSHNADKNKDIILKWYNVSLFIPIYNYNN